MKLTVGIAASEYVIGGGTNTYKVMITVGLLT